MKLSDPIQHYTLDAVHFDYFEERSAADRDSTERIQQAVFHAARLTAADRVLDVGSGNGWLAVACARRSLRTPVLVDIGLANLKNIRAFHGNVAHTVVADASRLPFRDTTFTCVVASEVLEHVNEPAAVLREARRVLDDSGRFIASTPYREKLRYSLCIHCNHVTPVNAHLHSFDERRHEELLQSEGFTAIRHHLHMNKLFMYSRLSRLLNFLPFSLWRIVDSLLTLLIRKCATIVVHAAPR